MYIYGVLLVPVLFSLLVGTNLEVWSKARINYAFIFGACIILTLAMKPNAHVRAELDVRTQLDHREYFEVRLLFLHR